MHTNGDGNGNGLKEVWPAGVVTGAYPEDDVDQTGTGQTIADDEIVFDSEEMEAAVADPDARLRKKRRRKKIVGASVILLFVAAVGGAGGYYLLRRGVKLDVILGKKDTNPAATRSEAAGGGNNLTQQALKEMHEVTKNTPADSAQAPLGAGEGDTPAAALPEGLAGTIRRPPMSEHGAGLGTGASAETKAEADAVNSRADGGRSSEPNPRPATGAGASRRNAERSIRMTPVASTEAGRKTELATPIGGAAEATSTAAAKTEEPGGAGGAARREDSAAVAVPGFGTMLPVKTLGAIYTLRSSSLARFELTRDVEGVGWSLKRGTVFVGSLRGGEYDRAYVSLIGFIDPETRRLVKVEGEILGGDGAGGLRGKRRQLSSRWSRMLGEGWRAAVGLTQSALSRGNGGTTVIMPGVQGVVGPEVTALSGRGNNNREFVEVAAGAPAYVMITDLPETIKGADAGGELEPEQLTRALEAGERGNGSGLTDAELATLLSSGSDDEIHAALPRMTPRMRRVALGVLEQTAR